MHIICTYVYTCELDALSIMSMSLVFEVFFFRQIVELLENREGIYAYLSVYVIGHYV